MRAVLQRVREASVQVEGLVCGAIGPGLLVLLGVGRDDSPVDASALADKICRLRIFDDENGIMNRSLLDTGGQMLVVSQFTLFGDCRKGLRPSWSSAAPSEKAISLYELFIETVSRKGIEVATGRFQAEMQVGLVNDGPVTLLLDSHKQF